jgi:hypothetical protein
MLQTRRTFKMKVRDLVFEVKIKPLFRIFGWTIAGLKARRVFEAQDGKGISSGSERRQGRVSETSAQADGQ